MILNPNKKIVNAIKKRLEVTGGQCPCVPKTQWCDDTLCVCKDMRENNICHCGLYVKQENA